MNKKEHQEIKKMLKEEENVYPKKTEKKRKQFLTKGQWHTIELVIALGLLLGFTIGISKWFDEYRLIWQSPVIVRTPVYYEKRVEQQPVEAQIKPEPTATPAPTPEPTPSPTPTSEWKKGKVSAYSCGGLETEADIKMNCPSLFSGSPRTATGQTPVANKTIACDRANLGKRFEIEGVGIVTCNDVGGAIKGSGRFDLYLETVHEARRFGVKELNYKEVV